MLSASLYIVLCASDQANMLLNMMNMLNYYVLKVNIGIESIPASWW